MAQVHVYVDPDELDKSVCPYYQRYIGAPGHDPDGTCSFGCRDEPSCVTDQPAGGWPAEQPVYDRSVTIVEVRTPR